MQQTIMFTVDRANWCLKYSDEIMEDGFKKPIPSNDIDDRSIRSSTFDTLEEAETFAKNIISNRTYSNGELDIWLAYLEIRKHIIETIQVILPK